MEPASRRDRLYAQMVDSLIFVAFGIGGAIVIPVLKDTPVLVYASVAVIGLSFVVTIGVQLWWLTTRGQTIGKRLMGIRIVRADDGANGGFVVNVLLRTVPVAVAGAVPVLGPALNLADVLFIFREDRRCLHDHVAGTRVVVDAAPTA